MVSRAAREKKNDMLIMSEVRTSSLAFNAWGTPCKLPLCLFLPHLLSLYLSLSFFFSVHSPSSYTASCSPVPPSPGPSGIETLTQQCKCREGWAACVRIQSGLAGRSKEMESGGPRRNFLTSPSQAAPQHGCVSERSERSASPFRNPPSLTPPQ